MGHLKDPDGVDLVIRSRPLTKEEETTISRYIRAYKTRRSPGRRKRKKSASAGKRQPILLREPKGKYRRGKRKKGE